MYEILRHENKKLKGFTLLETMITAVLTTVIALLALAAVNIFKSQSENQFRELDKSVQSLNFYSTFYFDITKSKRIIRSEDSVLLTFPDHELIYLFDESRVVRKMFVEDIEKADTFYLEKVVLMDNSPKELKSRLNENFAVKWIQDETSKTIEITKEYSAEELMNSEYGN